MEPWRWCQGAFSWPFLGMVMVVLAQVSNLMVSKVAMSTGMSNFILVVYSDALSTLILLPLSLFISLRPEHPRLSFSVLCRLFLLSFVGCLGQISGYAGIEYSSPTLDTAMLNIVPALTFLLAIIFRMETVLDWKRSSTQAKSVGTVVSIAGALVVTLYKGPLILTPPWAHRLVLSTQKNWILGGLFCAFGALTTSIWFIFQASILEIYPSELNTVFFYCFFGTIQSAVVSLIAVRDLSSWMLRLDVELVAVFYAAAIGTVFRVCLASWCLRRIGPFSASMFKPLANVVAFIMGFLFLGEALYLGSVVGAFIIIAGFYAVMWGKAKENETSKDAGEEESSESSGLALESPLLLPNHSRQI